MLQEIAEPFVRCDGVKKFDVPPFRRIDAKVVKVRFIEIGRQPEKPLYTLEDRELVPTEVTEIIDQKISAERFTVALNLPLKFFFRETEKDRPTLFYKFRLIAIVQEIPEVRRQIIVRVVFLPIKRNGKFRRVPEREYDFRIRIILFDIIDCFGIKPACWGKITGNLTGS